MSLPGSDPPVQRDDLPREVLAWLRSLKLPRVPRNVKRDLSNGFIVAIICSRYWSNITMHSYDDKMSIANKRRNWNMLKKQFALNNCTLSDLMIEGMISCRENYAIIFLRQLFTLLTGRPILEAVPLPAEEVVPSQNFMLTSTAPKSSATINVGFAPVLNNQTATASRVRELPTSNISKLGNSGNAPLLNTTDERVVRAIVSDQGGDNSAAEDGGEEGEENFKGDKAPLKFSVSLRRCNVQNTVVCETRKSASPDSFLSEKEKQSFFDETHPATHYSKVLDFIEFTVRTHVGKQDWPGLCDSPVAFVDYFLQNEEALGALLRCRVWSALHASLNDITERVFHQGVSIFDVVALFLQTVKPQKQQEPQLSQERKVVVRKLSSTSYLSKKPLPTQRYVFLAALLSSISEADAFLAVAVYCNDVLPNCVAAMSSLDYAEADNYASLLTAALPLDRKLAAHFFPDVLSTVYSAITVSSDSLGRSSFYLLLRAILRRLVQGKSEGHSQASRTTSLDSTVVESSVHDDPLLRVVHAIGEYHVVAALSNESSRVRLVGAHLAESLVSTGCSLTSLFDAVLPSMSSCCASSSMIFKCVCAAWMWAVFKRVKYSFHRKSTAIALENEIIDESSVDKLCFRAVPYFASMMRVLCDSLLIAEPIKTKLYIAQHLALCLDNIPADKDIQPLFNLEKVAANVFSVFCQAPQKLLATFLSPTSSLEGRYRSRRSTGSKQTAASLSVNSAILGPLVVNGSLSDCYPLALSEAVLVAFSRETTTTTTTTAGDGRTIKKSLNPNNGERHGSGGGGGVAMRPLTPSHIMGRATSLLRDRALPVDISQRVTWLHKIMVDSRINSDLLETPLSLSEAAAAQRWNSVMCQMYYDIATLTTAAEMLCTQKGAIADASAVNSIALAAGMAQQIVSQWHAAFGKDVGPLAKPNLNKSSAAANQITKAMEWYQEKFGKGMESGKKM